MKTDIAILGEQIEVLAGTLTRDKSEAAVRISDLTGFMQVKPTIQAKFSVAAPTKAEFDALVRDVMEMRKAARIVADALHKRLQP